MRQFTYQFDEMPLIIAGDIEGGLINGQAEIRYNNEGEWDIQSVAIEGYKPLTQAERAAGKKPWVYVDAPEAITAIIHKRLNDEWYVRVCNAVMEQMAIDREEAAEYRAEQRREEMGAW